ncbi:hypothetical protein C7B77_13960 [Chamaesiphon polymorphus CCALA 037]|uniref:Uncharacterized protein n=1 Tax=Chamaesiphon polymorphus CCALA 037 TaxID=2107692 RepID=A0A2T1GE93_9CYAN|nr:hypothetical protein C7B77_13960 [Chamaesiphon polymorphus CCALA 037]
MEPTPNQFRELFLIGRELTAQLRCYIRLIDMLPNGELCLVVQPREFPTQHIIIYINSIGERRYV